MIAVTKEILEGLRFTIEHAGFYQDVPQATTEKVQIGVAWLKSFVDNETDRINSKSLVNLTTPDGEEIEVDAEIAETVQWLWKHNYQTISSCAGGSGHQFEMPTVTLKHHTYDSYALASVLILGGAQGFTIIRYSEYQKEVPCFAKSMAVQFWSLDGLPKRTDENKNSKEIDS